MQESCFYGLKNYNKTDLYKHLGKTEPVPVKVEGGICWGEEEKSFVLAKEREIELSQIELSALIKEGEKTRKKVILPPEVRCSCKRGREDWTGTILYRRYAYGRTFII